MNSFPKFCPNCKNYPTLRMNRTKINIKCKCGYDKVISIIEYLNQLKDSNSHHCIINNKVAEITKEINRGSYDKIVDIIDCSHQYTTYTKLNNIINDINSEYYKVLHDINAINDNLMSKMKKQFFDLESSYKKCVTENTAIFCLLQILVDNYNDSKEMESNIILNSNIQYYYCENDKNIDDVIDYYKTYSIIEPTYKDLISIS